MPDKEIITLPSAGSIPGFPGSHGPGSYEADYTTRTLRRVVDGVPIDEPAPELYMVDLGGYAGAGGLEVLQAAASDAPEAPAAPAEPEPVQEAAPVVEAPPAASESEIEAPAPEEVPAAPTEASEPEPSDPAAEAAHEA